MSKNVRPIPKSADPKVAAHSAVAHDPAPKGVTKTQPSVLPKHVPATGATKPATQAAGSINATVAASERARVAAHARHIASVTGKKH